VLQLLQLLFVRVWHWRWLSGNANVYSL